MPEDTFPLDKATAIVKEAREKPIESAHIATSDFLGVESMPLLVMKHDVFPEVFASGEGEGPMRQIALIIMTSEDPIRHFNVQQIKGWFDVVIGLKGKFQMNVVNPTPFVTKGTMYLRAVGDGFVFVDSIFSFDLPRLSTNQLVFSWSLGIWDILVRAFWSLFSSETTCSGTLTIGMFSHDFDVTKKIPIEKA